MFDVLQLLDRMLPELDELLIVLTCLALAYINPVRFKVRP